MRAGPLVRTANGLAYHWRDHFVLALDPIGKDLFAVQGSEDYRFHLVRENGVVRGLERVWKSGQMATYRPRAWRRRPGPAS
jgi:hypothetical protein